MKLRVVKPGDPMPEGWSRVGGIGSRAHYFQGMRSICGLRLATPSEMEHLSPTTWAKPCKHCLRGVRLGP